MNIEGLKYLFIRSGKLCFEVAFVAHSYEYPAAFFEHNISFCYRIFPKFLDIPNLSELEFFPFQRIKKEKRESYGSNIVIIPIFIVDVFRFIKKKRKEREARITRRFHCSFWNCSVSWFTRNTRIQTIPFVDNFVTFRSAADASNARIVFESNRFTRRGYLR